MHGAWTSLHRLHLPRGQTRLSLASQRVPKEPPEGDLLTPAEWGLLSERALPRRRAEFVAGRLAARAAVRSLCNALGPIDIVRHEHGPRQGAPLVLRSGRACGIEVSITHSAGMALAAATEGPPLGVDLVFVEPRPPSFQEEAFAQREIQLWSQVLPGAAEAVVQSVAFAAKEAVFKWLGCGLRKPLRSVEVTPLYLGEQAPLQPLAITAKGEAFVLSLHGFLFGDRSQIAVVLSRWP